MQEGRITKSVPDSCFAHGLLTVKGAAEYLKVSRTTLYSLMDRGLLPYTMVGNSRRILKRHIIDMLNSGMRGRI